MRSIISMSVLAGLAATSLAAAPTAPLDDAQEPLDAVIDTAGTAVGACDDLDDRECLLPFPNDQFTTLDATTPTGTPDRPVADRHPRDWGELDEHPETLATVKTAC